MEYWSIGLVVITTVLLWLLIRRS